jgi:hypothetical protein
MSLRRIVPAAVSIAGLLFLSYILGAAVIRFKLATSQYLLDAFDGAQAWAQQQDELAAISTPTNSIVSNHVDVPDRTFDGFTLYTTNVDWKVRLINMRGEVVHTWDAKFRKIWPQPIHLGDNAPEEGIYHFGGYLYPNGDLLVVFHGTGATPYGYGLAKLDKDSNVIWRFSTNVHHSVDVGPDGTIYALNQRLVHEMPPGMEFFPARGLLDDLILLSPDGKVKKTISLLEAFRDSPFAPMLSLSLTARQNQWDVLHTNAVEVLTPEMAKHFPMFQPGQVLISLRELDALAMIDVEKGAVVWAARGPWRGQHDPHFLDNGRILVFDNRGANSYSRVMEYDPRSQATPWCYPSPNAPTFLSAIQGRTQRLENGNTLIVNSNEGVILEVAPDQSIVWSCNCHAHVPIARRYAPDQLPFLKGVCNARP